MIGRERCVAVLFVLSLMPGCGSSQDPLFESQRVAPVNAADLAEAWDSGAAIAPPPVEDATRDDPPESTHNALADELLAQQRAPVTFRDPDVASTLRVVYKLIVAYNEERGRGPGSVPGQLNVRSRTPDRVPSLDELKAWFAKLSYRRRVAIDWRFHDPRKIEDFENAEREKWRPGDPADFTRGGSEIECFADPMNVFLSPRDGQPLVIGVQIRPQPVRMPHPHLPPPIVVREAKGVRGTNRRFLTGQTERKAIDALGEIITLIDVDPE